jgi:hypothetical protein
MPSPLRTIDRLDILAKTVARRWAEQTGQTPSPELIDHMRHALCMVYYVACGASADAIQKTADATEDELLRLAMESLALHVRRQGELVKGTSNYDSFGGFFPEEDAE